MIKINRGQIAAGTLAFNAIVFVVGVGTTAVIDKFFSSGSQVANAESALENRVVKVETEQETDHQSIVNQQNQANWMAAALQKIGAKLNVDVGQPPANQ